jgi:hypothetical protein
VVEQSVGVDRARLWGAELAGVALSDTRPHAPELLSSVGGAGLGGHGT